MKIGVIGKGGSGKSSTSWMLMQAGLQLGYNTWGLDADYNQHLSHMFGVPNTSIKALADHRAALTRHVIGARQDVTIETFDKATLPAKGSNLIVLSVDDPFLKNFTVSPGERLHLLRVGEFRDEDKGLRCYHGRTAAADILLSHLAPLEDKQLLVVDFTAGVDPFASPIYLKLDAFVLVVEPTLKGIEVVRQWRNLLADTPVSLLIAGNKLDSDEDETWLADTLGQPVDLALSQESALRQGERGHSIGWGDLLPGNRSGMLDFIGSLPSRLDAENTSKRVAMLNALAERRASL